MDVLIGKKSEYRIIAELGRGGMCSVFKAEDKDGNIVALKRLRNDPGSRLADGALGLFNEAGIMEILNEAEIIGIPDFIDSGDGFYVMEFLQGQTLMDWVLCERKKRRRREGGLPAYEQRVLQVLTELCDILMRLHDCESPIIHLDIKPSNVIVDKQGMVYLIDFGSAICLQCFGVDSKRVKYYGTGTREYAAPEQYGDSFIRDRRTDIYQYGILLKKIIRYGDMDVFLCGEIEDVAEKCTEPRAFERFASMRKVKEELLNSIKKARRKKGFFIIKLLLSAFLFVGAAATAIAVAAAAEAGSFFDGRFGVMMLIVNVFSVSAGHILWNGEELLYSAKKVFLRGLNISGDACKERQCENITELEEDSAGELFIDIVMTKDSIDFCEQMF